MVRADLANSDIAKACQLDSQFCFTLAITMPTATPRPMPTATPRPSPQIDDHGNNRSSATSTSLTVDNSPLWILATFGNPGDIDTFSFRANNRDTFVFQANYLLRGAIVTGVGHPKMVFYTSSPAAPLKIDDRGGLLVKTEVDGGTIYLDVSSYNPDLIHDYQIVVDRIAR